MSEASSMIDRPLDELIKDAKKQKSNNQQQKKKKDGNKSKDGEKKPQPKNKQQQNGGQQQQKKQKDQADGNKNKNNKPRNENKPKQQQGDQKQRNQAQPQKKQHAGTGGHLAKIRAQAESKGPQQKSNKFKPAGEKIQSGKQQKLTKRNSLDDLKITVEGKDKKQNAGRAGIFKEHKSSPKPAKQQRQKQDNGSVDDLRISVAVPEQQQQRKDVQTKSKEQTKEKAKQKVAAAKTEERAAQLHERRVIAAGAVAASTDSKPKTLSERWSAAVASIPVPAPGSRVVYIAK